MWADWFYHTSVLQKAKPRQFTLKIAQTGSAGVVPQIKGEKETSLVAEMRVGHHSTLWSEHGADLQVMGMPDLLPACSSPDPAELEQAQGCCLYATGEKISLSPK